MRLGDVLKNIIVAKVLQNIIVAKVLKKHYCCQGIVEHNCGNTELGDDRKHGGCNY